MLFFFWFKERRNFKLSWLHLLFMAFSLSLNGFKLLLIQMIDKVYWDQLKSKNQIFFFFNLILWGHLLLKKHFLLECGVTVKFGSYHFLKTSILFLKL